MIGNLMGGDGLIVIVVALVVLVGGSQLPKIARNVGLAGREFRKAQAEAEEEKAKAEPAALPATPAVAPPVTPVTTPQAGGAPATGSDGSITLTPAQLEALLKAREEQAHTQPGAN